MIRDGSTRRWGLMLATIIAVSLLASCRPAAPPAQPGRIVSGSMAPEFWGKHWKVVCDDCGHTFRCGVEHPPSNMLAVCPNCGFRKNKIDEDAVQPGTPVEIVPRDLLAEPLGRWEVIAFAEPGGDGRTAVKRVVGLPGERVGVREGDLFINGRRVQKSMQEFSIFGRGIFNVMNIPKLSADFPNRWRPASSDSKWENMRPVVPGHRLRCYRADNEAAEFDWLVYHHLRRTADGEPRFAEAKILDSNAYNQGLARGLNRLTDLMHLCAVKLRGNGELRFRLVGGERPLFASLSVGDNKVSIWRGRSKIAETDVSSPALGNGLPVGLCVGILDRRFVVEINDELKLACDLDVEAISLDVDNISLAIGNRALDVDLVMPDIFRDIYYLNPHHRAGDWEMDAPLGEGEYFVLGDNPPNSVDSRHYGAIHRDAIVGSVRVRDDR